MTVGVQACYPRGVLAPLGAWRMAAWPHGAKVATQRLGILTAFAPSIAKLRQGEVTLVLSLLVDVFIHGTT